MAKFDSVSIDKGMRRVEIIFKLRNGYFYMRCKDGDLREVREEKPIHTLPEHEQYEIRAKTLIIYKLIFTYKNGL